MPSALARIALALGCSALPLGCSAGDVERSSAPLTSQGVQVAPSSTLQAGVECAAPVASNEHTLADAFAEHFRAGVALSSATFGSPENAAAQLVRTHFNQISPENVLKWSEVHPSADTYRFDEADKFVAFGEQAAMLVYGHVLVWHQQTPSWVFESAPGQPATPEQLLATLEEHIGALATRYGGRIAYWDVVNEAFNDDGSLRQSPWRDILGDDYIAQVFEMAARLLPDTRLVYNDYSMFLTGKRDATVALVLDLKARGLRIDAVGMQGHYNLTRPSVDELHATLAAFAATGVEVLVTEMDVDVLPSERDVQGADLNDMQAYSAALNPYPRCLPAELDAQIAARWRELFDVFVAHADSIGSITFWGVSDGHSWLNNWPVSGRRNYPLLFDRDLQPKSNFEQVIQSTNP